MDIDAFVIAMLGAIFVFSGFFIAYNIESGVKANLLRLTSCFGGFICMPLMQSLTHMPAENFTKSGEYWFYILIVGAILTKIFGGTKNITE